MLQPCVAVKLSEKFGAKPTFHLHVGEQVMTDFSFLSEVN